MVVVCWYVFGLGGLHLEKSRMQSNLRKTMELISHGNKATAQEIISICKTETVMAPVYNQNLLWQF